MNIEVSVVLPIFNGGRYLETAVKSILYQTLEAFELIIVDDGSTDCTGELLARLAQADTRIVIIRNEGNEGVQKSLNKAIRASRGDYIARMDADDVSLPSRLDKQIAVFRENKDLVLVGSNCTLVDEKLSFIRPSFVPLDDWSIRCMFLFFNPFIHSTVMLNGSVVREQGLRYDTSLKASVDYEMWGRVLDYGSVRNLPDQLVLLRKHGGSFTNRYSKEQIDCFFKARNSYRKKLFGEQADSTQKYELDKAGFDPLNFDRGDVNPLNSISGCKSSMLMAETLSVRYPGKPAFKVHAFIASRAIWTAVRLFSEKGSQTLLRSAVQNDYKTLLGMVRLIFFRLWQYTQIIRLQHFKYRSGVR